METGELFKEDEASRELFSLPMSIKKPRLLKLTNEVNSEGGPEIFTPQECSSKSVDCTKRIQTLLL